MGVDEGSGEILAAVVTTNDVADCEVRPDLLEQIDQQIEQVSGDGCYDTIARGAKATILLRINAEMQQPHPYSQPYPRDENLRWVNQVGRKQWKHVSGYHRRYASETAIFRLMCSL
ncbi:hypothetical protein Nos7107_3355 [Nostoc sp. PCC 7107]|nr:hypothetical protein Nos7107_3355 [Nostoc sp. PCC 7107]